MAARTMAANHERMGLVCDTKVFCGEPPCGGRGTGTCRGAVRP